jgi:hypothetical protein
MSGVYKHSIMTEDEFLNFVRKAVCRVTRYIGRIGSLVCTQTEGNGEPTLREPEMRTALQQQADEDRLLYGIEVPTIHDYRFSGTGEGKRRALIDFALLNSDTPNALRKVLVELKEGQPACVKTDQGEDNYPTITKDLHKLIAEPSSHGACMLHICQTSDAGTIPSVLLKYNCAMKTAIDNATVTTNSQVPPIWPLLLIFVVRGKGAGLFYYKWQVSAKKWEIMPH